MAFPHYVMVNIQAWVQLLSLSYTTIFPDQTLKEIMPHRYRRFVDSGAKVEENNKATVTTRQHCRQQRLVLSGKQISPRNQQTADIYIYK